MTTANDVQPLLHIALVLELSLRSSTRCLKERVEIELIKLTPTRNRQQLVWHLIGQQAHLRESAVGVTFIGVLDGKSFFGSLLVGVRPVEDLFLNELAGGQRFEGGSRQVQVSPCGDGQELRLLVG